MRCTVFTAAGLVALLLLPGAVPGQAVPVRVSVSSAGVQGDSGSTFPALSGDGRYVAFASHATNLVPADTNGYFDVFVHDRTAGLTSRVSVGALGLQADQSSTQPWISADGRFVAFMSNATNLVAGDGNGLPDIFVKDRSTGLVVLASVSTAGAPSDGASYAASLSDDGNRVAFTSAAANLVANDTNGLEDVFVRDRAAGTTVRVSVSSLGAQMVSNVFPVLLTASIAADGSAVLFVSAAGNLVPNDVNGTWDAFVHVLATGQTTLESLLPTGVQPPAGVLDAAISGDGRFVAFHSGGQLFRRDRLLAQTIAVPYTMPPGGTGISRVAISGDGATIALFGHQLVAPPAFGSRTIVLLVDALSGATRSMGGDAAGVIGVEPIAHLGPAHGSLAADGRHVAWSSKGSAIVPGDTNSEEDVFAVDVAPRLDANATAPIGSVLALHLNAPEDAGRLYQVALALGYQPGIPLGLRYVPLNPDDLCLLSLSGFPLFGGFSGALDGGGQATATVALTVPPVFVGVGFYAAGVVIDPLWPFGIRAATNAVRWAIVP